LLELQEISRMLPSELLTNSEKLNRFCQLLTCTCSFIDDVNDSRIPNSAVFVYGKREPCRTAEHTVIEKMKRCHGSNVRCSESMDEESTTTGDWMPASATSRNILNAKVKEPEHLYFYPKGRYECTFNHPKSKFSNSQLAMLFELPVQQSLDSFEPIELLIAPPGCKSYPDDTVTPEELIETHGWTKQQVGVSFMQEKPIGPGVKGRRQQYGLRPRIASTIHAVMGQTIPALVTQVSEVEPYDLWDASQVVVLLSRTRKGQDIFVCWKTR
jgi:hypothetical protein